MLDNDLVIHCEKITPRAVLKEKHKGERTLFDSSTAPEVNYRSEQHPIDGVLNFGNTTYEDGVLVFVNNKE